MWGGWDQSFTPPGDPSLYALSAFRFLGISGIRSIAAGANHLLMLGTNPVVSHGQTPMFEDQGRQFVALCRQIFQHILSGGWLPLGGFARCVQTEFGVEDFPQLLG